MAVTYIQAVTSVLRLGGVSLFARPKGRGGSRAQRKFQSLIDFSFPKIVGEEKHFLTYPFSVTYRNLYTFSVIFS
jgi:hypothetical protein